MTTVLALDIATMPPRKRPTTRVACPHCGAEYERRVDAIRKDGGPSYCSVVCSAAARRAGGRITVNCEWCGIAVEKHLSAVAKVKHRFYCSRPCRFAAQKGTINPNWKGGLVRRACEACGAAFAVKPHRIGYRSVKYCSDACRRKTERIYPDAQTKRREGGRRHNACKRAGRAIRTHTHQQWLDLLRRAKHRCVKCGAKKDMTRDHIIPLSKGGHDGITNIQPLCRGCNSRKHANVETLL